MAEARYWHGEARNGVNSVRRCPDFGFDPRRGEEYVNDRSDFVVAGKCEPNGPEPSHHVLLHCREDPPAASLESPNESLGISIVSDNHCEIRVARQPGL